MGLDMYLDARKYMSPYFDAEDEQRINTINEMFGLPKVDKDSGRAVAAKNVSFEAAYWRKANAIHKWFVENVQNGEDDCGDYYVSREQLQELLDTCKKVLEHNSKAEELLPTTSGFFFGGTQYDEWYYSDLEFTIERLTELLASPVFQGMDFYYHSSW